MKWTVQPSTCYHFVQMMQHRLLNKKFKARKISESIFKLTSPLNSELCRFRKS